MGTRSRSDRNVAASLIYQRGSSGRFYVDLREYGGDREALLPEGESYATTDKLIALDLAARRVEALLAAQRTRHFTGQTRAATVGQIAREWIESRHATTGSESDVQPATLARYESALFNLFGVMDEHQDIATVSKQSVKQALADLRARGSRTGGKLSASSVHQVIVAMQLVYDFAADTGAVPEDHNPWRRLRRADRPKTPRGSSTDFLEVFEAHAMLEAADLVDSRTIPLRTIIATLLLTGGRRDEVLGLELRDIDFRRKTIRFHTNVWRRIKTGEERTVPLWPQLERELRAYLARERRISGLLFPGREARSGREHMITRIDIPIVKARDIAAEALGPELGARLRAKAVSPRALRPTYCAARLQTTDRGEAVAIWTVRAEMGHSSRDMIDRVYGRLGAVRHRSPVVEYTALDEATRREVLGL